MRTQTQSLLRGFLRMLAVLCFAFTSAMFAAEAKKSFNLPAGDAEQTLKLFKDQSGAQILYPPTKVSGIQTNAVSGEMTPSEALDVMLAKTKLVAVHDGKTGATTIRQEATVELAEKNGSGRPENDRAADGQVTGTIKLDTFEVFGRKTLNMDIPRNRDDVQPYVVFSRDQLEASNATNLDDFFRTRLPMNNPFATAPNNLSNPIATSSISLRGLSTNQTLILIDGRRAAPRISAGAGAGLLQSDINGIPLSMIERVEILPSTASGIYGGGATGGVINIITRKDYSGVELTLSYANTFQTDFARRRVDLNGSFRLEDGRTLLTISSSYTDGNQLMVRDRDLARRSLALQLANNPAAIYGASSPPLGYTSNIRNQTAANLVLKPQYGGATLNSPFTFVPVGYTGIASDNAAALAANAGKYNLDFADSASGGRTGLGSSPENRSVELGLRRKFGANVEFYLDYSVLKTHNQLESATGSLNATLPNTAPNNPFTTTIVVRAPTPGLVDVFSGYSESHQLLVGSVVHLPHDWTTGLDYNYAHSRNGTKQPTGVLGDPDGAGPLPSISAALANGTEDVMRDLNRQPLNYAAYRQPQPYTITNLEGSIQELTARAAGPAWSLPGGPLALAGSVSWREETQPALVSENSILVPSRFTYFPPAWRQNSSAYLEARLPVLAENRGGWLRALEVQASARYDRYRLHTLANSQSNTITGSDGPFPTVPMQTVELDAVSKTAGFKYSPVQDFAVRASWGTGFLPPSMGDLTPSVPFATSGVTVSDPKRGGALADTGPVQIQGGGDPNLKPENSRSLSAGFVFTPRFLPGLRLSVDFTKIDKTNEIVSLLAQQAFDFEDFLPGVVVRAPLTAADQALGYTGGVVTTVRSGGSVNMARKKLTAYDLQADYEMRAARFGQFHFYALATYQPELQSQPVIGAPFSENIGYSSGGVRWRGNGGLDWKFGQWTAGWNVQYYDSYLGYSSTASAASQAAFILNQGAAKIPSQSYHDITIGYQFRSGTEGWRHWLANTRILAGVQNVFNTRPPVIASTTVSGGFSGYGDPRLARYTLTLRKSF